MTPGNSDGQASPQESHVEPVSHDEWERRQAAQFRAMPAKTAGPSSAISFDTEFLSRNARQVIRDLQAYHSGTMEIIGFTPYWRTNSGEGVFGLEFRAAQKEVKDYRLFVEFGAPAPSRRNFDAGVAFDQDDRLVFNESLHVDNWDEAWAFACLVAQIMRLTAVTIRYGM